MRSSTAAIKVLRSSWRVTVNWICLADGAGGVGAGVEVGLCGAGATGDCAGKVAAGVGVDAGKDGVASGRREAGGTAVREGSAGPGEGAIGRLWEGEPLQPQRARVTAVRKMATGGYFILDLSLRRTGPDAPSARPV
jgi:hypothetical protein